MIGIGTEELHTTHQTLNWAFANIFQLSDRQRDYIEKTWAQLARYNQTLTFLSCYQLP